MESPRLNAERMLAHVLGLGRVDLYLKFDRPLDDAERAAFREILRRRAAREPLQYLLGETEFFSLAFRVTPAVLIPRPETEILVEAAIGRLAGRGPVRVLDVGTGSGAIAVALARHLPDARVDAADSEDGALEAASGNAERHGVSERIRFLRADCLAADFAAALSPPYHAVVSNPPYVSAAEWPGLAPEIRNHEPKKALCDGGDGLAFYRALAAAGSGLLLPDGRMFLEIGAGQENAVRALVEAAGGRVVAVRPDLNGLPRVVEAGFGAAVDSPPLKTGTGPR